MYIHVHIHICNYCIMNFSQKEKLLFIISDTGFRMFEKFYETLLTIMYLKAHKL